jgi:hypothetical protein
MNAGDWITFASISIAACTLWYQINGMRKQLTIQNFSEYTKRYQEIILKFPEEINEQDFDLKIRDDYKQTMRYMRAYFDLCFEEFYLHQRNLIDKKIWGMWKDGMEFAFKKPAFKQAWDIITRDTLYDADFKKFVSNALS